MTYRYTIYCGLKVGTDDSPTTIRRSRQKVYEAADRNFVGYTITEGVGRWRGQTEPTSIVHYITDKQTDITKVNSFAHEYKWGNNQESVMIVEEQVDLCFY